MNPDISHGEWVRTTEATVQLGLSRTSLTKHKANGYFKRGRHWITTGPYDTSPLLWNIAAVRETMARWAAPRGTK
jgi:hypothetical protein